MVEAVAEEAIDTSVNMALVNALNETPVNKVFVYEAEDGDDLDDMFEELSDALKHIGSTRNVYTVTHERTVYAASI